MNGKSDFDSRQTLISMHTMNAMNNLRKMKENHVGNEAKINSFTNSSDSAEK
jgi:hypothetical protein